MKQTLPPIDPEQVKYLFDNIFQYKEPKGSLERTKSEQPPHLDLNKAELEIDLHYARLAIAALKKELLQRDDTIKQLQIEKNHYRTALEDVEYELQLIQETTPTMVDDNNQARQSYSKLRCLLQKPLAIIQKRLP